MRKVWAVIKNAKVINTIVTDESFTGPNGEVDVTDTTCNIGDTYAAGVFTTPTVMATDTPPEPIDAAPITLSPGSNSVEVTLTQGILTIGCLTFDAAWVKATLTSLIVDNAAFVGQVQASRDGAIYGGFLIAWADCQAIVDYLTTAGV